MALSLQRYVYESSSNFDAFLKERSKKEEDKVTEIVTKSGDLLHEVLIIEILSWLPVKALLRFKIVCKSWFRIITSRQFVDKHLKNYYNHTDSWCRCFLANYTYGHAGVRYLELLVDETPRILADAELNIKYGDGLFMCGPCDGIYYISENDFGGRHSLWNPALNELKRLPPVPDPPNSTSSVFGFYGFGLDPITKDYKVVVIKDRVEETCHPLAVFIYSLRTDSWRYWGDLARYYQLLTNLCYICVNGCFYWLGSYYRYQKKPEVIISFDMGADAYQEIKLPNYNQRASTSLGIYDDSQRASTSLGMYDDSIAFLTFVDKRLDVWTLKESLWAKIFTIETTLFDVRRPLGQWKNNMLLLEGGDNRLVLCDTNAREVRDLGSGRDLDRHRLEALCVYMESLVSITDRDINRWIPDDEAQKTDNH